MASSRHGSSVRGLDKVSQSSIRDARFGRLFRNLPAAPFPEPALLDLAKTMFHGEFDDHSHDKSSQTWLSRHICLSSAFRGGAAMLGGFLAGKLRQRR